MRKEEEIATNQAFVRNLPLLKDNGAKVAQVRPSQLWFSDSEIPPSSCQGVLQERGYS